MFPGEYNLNPMHTITFKEKLQQDATQSTGDLYPKDDSIALQSRLRYVLVVQIRSRLAGYKVQAVFPQGWILLTGKGRSR